MIPKTTRLTIRLLIMFGHSYEFIASNIGVCKKSVENIAHEVLSEDDVQFLLQEYDKKKGIDIVRWTDVVNKALRQVQDKLSDASAAQATVIAGIADDKRFRAKEGVSERIELAAVDAGKLRKELEEIQSIRAKIKDIKKNSG